MSTTYNVKATRWEGGWELHISDNDVTQVRTLDKAVQQVRDYLDTMYDGSHDNDAINIIPDLGGDEIEIKQAKDQMDTGVRLQNEAAARIRVITKRLRESGMSVTDTAAVLGVSRGRVTQLSATHAKEDHRV